MKCRFACAVLSGVLLGSFAAAQTPSHFDLSGNLSFNGATLPSAPSSVQAIGWQTSGVTRLNRWFALTSQFSSSSASTDSVQLVGFTGPGTLRHYSVMTGPRFIVPTRSRFSPFVEGLVGGDWASTNLTSNGTSVTGKEIQVAYAFGGGAQVIVSRHFALNFEGQYLNTEHTLAYTGWEPAHFQIAAGLVIRMFGRSPQIAEQPHRPTPASSGSSEPSMPTAVAENTASEVPTTNVATNIQPVVSTPIVQPQVAASNVQPPSVSYATTSAPATAPAAAPVAVAPTMTARLPAPVVEAKTTTPQAMTPQVLTPAPQTVATASPVSPSQPPVQPSVRASQPPATVAAVASTQTIDQAEAPPISLGEYARRLREKKEHSQNH
jgi:Outer membrane protein beta-barrel domain